jgi:pimeloyl-ACP methyl ester carboxylesterase
MGIARSADGTEVAFDRAGDGPAVILVGGALQYRSFDQPTQELARLLSESFTVFHYDRRGRGESGDTAPYAVEREVEDLQALIAEAGGSACLFGNSSGAHLVLEAALAGAPVRKLALYEIPVIVDDSRPPVPSDYSTQLNALLDAGQRGDAVALFMTTIAGVPAEFVASMRQAPMWPGFEAVAHTLAYDQALIGETQSSSPDPLRRWGTISAPTLVIDGGASEAWAHNGADAVAGTLADARRSTLAGQTHAVAPDVLAPVLIEFFNG